MATVKRYGPLIGALAFMCLMIGLAQGCTQNLQLKPISEMTPQEKDLVALKTYNSLVDAYKQKITLPNLSDAEKTVLRAEYATIQKMWPIIKTYDEYVQGNTGSIQESVLQAIDQFLGTYRY